MSFLVNLRDPTEIDRLIQLGGAQWIECLIRGHIREWYTDADALVKLGYEVEYNDKLAESHLPIVAEYERSKVKALLHLDDPSELEAIYYRIVKGSSESCIEYIYYWNFQPLPPHSYDYEPIYVYLKNENGKEVRVAFDYFHYDVCVRSFPRVKGFQICGPWHAFDALDVAPAPRKRLERVDLIRLDSTVLGKWYGRSKQSKFEINRKLTDPWLLNPKVEKLTFRDDDKQIFRPFALAAVRDINGFYQDTVSIPSRKKRVSTFVAQGISVNGLSQNYLSQKQREIMDEFEAAGYVTVDEKGQASWTPEGGKIKEMLARNLEESRRPSKEPTSVNRGKRAARGDKVYASNTLPY